jgi:hypothetical protein
LLLYNTYVLFVKFTGETNKPSKNMRFRGIFGIMLLKIANKIWILSEQ